MATFPSVALAVQDSGGASALLTRASAYVRAHETQLMSMVGEERQVQQLLRPDGSRSRERVLVADVMLVKIGNRPYVFRDVATVDGKPVRAREDRLEKLFTSGSRTLAQQAQALVRESSRYDLDFPRFQALSGVLLPLLIVIGPQDRYRLAMSPDAVELEEIKSPTIYQQRDGGPPRDMPLRGRLTIDAATGVLRRGALTIRNDRLEAAIDVSYGERVPDLFIPMSMSESYRLPAKPREERLEIATEYSKFRRFTARLEEEIVLPGR
jgi:hypothetical protein